VEAGEAEQVLGQRRLLVLVPGEAVEGQRMVQEAGEAERVLARASEGELACEPLCCEAEGEAEAVEVASYQTLLLRHPTK
jgi:hypothetical protein